MFETLAKFRMLGSRRPGTAPVRPASANDNRPAAARPGHSRQRPPALVCRWAAVDGGRRLTCRWKLEDTAREPDPAPISQNRLPTVLTGRRRWSGRVHKRQ